VRVSDVDPEMLRYLSGREIAPRMRFEVVEKQPFGGPLFVRFGKEVHAIGGAIGAVMRVERAR
jgi:DtxR family Mn-dependent transcriptional regulator